MTYRPALFGFYTRQLILYPVYAVPGRVADAPVTDLAETSPDGSYKKTIIKVTDPEKYGINVRDCFV